MATCDDDAAAMHEVLLAALSAPQKMTTDAGSAEQHPLTSLIEADKYLASKCATTNNRRGFRLTRIVPPGTV